MNVTASMIEFNLQEQGLNAHVLGNGDCPVSTVRENRKRRHDAGVALGMIPGIHACGHCTDIIPDLADGGSAAWQSAQPSNDFHAILQQYGDKLTAMGATFGCTGGIPSFARTSSLRERLGQLQGGPESRRFQATAGFRHARRDVDVLWAFLRAGAAFDARARQARLVARHADAQHVMEEAGAPIERIALVARRGDRRTITTW